ncbi:MAG: GGDEF domain-containing protein, partial [Oscillospiraceae bacterium]|nr:GGDEF domain-containing protein [Oscillospiraceae bacterium]
MSEEKEFEIERLKRALSEEKVKNSILSEYSRFGLWEYHIADDLFYQYNTMFCKINGTNDPISHFREAVISNGGVFSEDLPEFSNFCSAMEHGENEVSCEIRVVNENSDTVRIKLEGKLVRDENELPIKYIGRVLDVTGEQTAKDRLSEKLDPLTEAYNLNAFREIIEEKRKGANCYTYAGLLAVGIDDFRGIMAKSGTEYTDYLQKTVAKILMGISVCERDCFIARVRDGEFLIFVTFEENSFLDNLAKRVIVNVKNYIFDGNTCTVSVGVSTFKNAHRLEDVYAEAMAALG